MQKTYQPITEQEKETAKLSKTWVKFIRYCEKLGFGELQNVQIQDGLPISIEVATKKIKFN